VTRSPHQYRGAWQQVRLSGLENLKGAFIQIMPLTWDSFLLPVMDKNPWLTI
jgi:hypothetical protein